jgi:hypothetical protein
MIYTDDQLADFLAKCRKAAHEDSKEARQQIENGAAARDVTELVRAARARGHTGPLVLGPSRRNGQGSWRDEVKWLEEHFPEEFRKPASEERHECIARNTERSQPALETVSNSRTPSKTATAAVASVPSRQPANRSTAAFATSPRCPPNAPGSTQNDSETQAASPPVQALPSLPSAFWRGLLFGSPDSLIGGADATSALRLMAEGIGVAIATNETIATLRAGQLRQLLRNKFGPVMAEETMTGLWRSAPSTPGAPQPNLDQSELPPGSWSDSRQVPRWVQELNEPGGPERDWLIENGMWAG